MPKRSSKLGPNDPNETAHRIVSEAVGDIAAEDRRNPAAVALGRLGGLKGGKARAKKLSKEERSRIARLAAEARWSRDDS